MRRKNLPLRTLGVKNRQKTAVLRNFKTKFIFANEEQVFRERNFPEIGQN